MYAERKHEVEMNRSSVAENQTRLDLCIVGETNLDLILYGLPDQMPMERELLGSGFEMTLGGSSSILAHNLAVLGTQVGFVSEVGSDAMGAIAREYLNDGGVKMSHFRQKSGAQTGVTVLLPHGKRRHILTYPGVMAELRVEDLDLAYLTSARHFHLSSLFLQTGLHRGLPELFQRLKSAGLTISLDTNDDPSGQWHGVLDLLLDSVDILLPNEDEILQMTHASTVDEALDRLGPQIPLIVVKCGSRGALVQVGKEREWIAPIIVDPVDTIGAGDSFNAGFLSTWLNGGDPIRSAAMGNLTGALSTLKAGGVAAHRDESLRRQFLAQHRLP